MYVDMFIQKREIKLQRRRCNKLKQILEKWKTSEGDEIKEKV